MSKIWSNNKLWLGLVLFSGSIIWLLQYLEFFKIIRSAAWLGVFFLILTIIPVNLLLWQKNYLGKEILIKLARNRRDFGIVAGLNFVFHAAWAWMSLANWDFSFLLIKPIIPGVVAIAIFLLLLLTSSSWSQILLKKKWKFIQRLVYFALPLGMIHSIQSEYFFDAQFSWLGAIGFGGMMIVSLTLDFKNLRAKNTSGQEVDIVSEFRHTILMSLGMVVALVFLFL